MGNLSNQYISQSFQSLLHLGSDNTASATFAEIQDALGNGVGVFVNTTGNLRVTNAISASAVSASTISGFGNPVSYSASVSDQLISLQNTASALILATSSFATTGSNNFVGNQNVTGDINVTGTLSAYKINTTIESSSVIFSSGSNILGDDASDIQTLNGLVRVSGNQQITGSLGVSQTITSNVVTTTTLTGIGNPTTYSASVDLRLTDLNAYRIIDNQKFNDLAVTTASMNISLDKLNSWTSSYQPVIVSLQASQSIDNTKWSNLGSQSGSFITESETGSFATTGSNSFNGNQTITGSVYGNTIALSITSQTASMNLSTSNLFTLTLVSGSATRLQPSNIKAGQTINLKVLQPAVGFGTIVIPSTILQPIGNTYSATPSASAQDIVTLISFGTTLYATSIKNLA
jgi:hypothetical protein